MKRWIFALAAATVGVLGIYGTYLSFEQDKALDAHGSKAIAAISTYDTHAPLIAGKLGLADTLGLRGYTANVTAEGPGNLRVEMGYIDISKSMAGKVDARQPIHIEYLAENPRIMREEGAKRASLMPLALSVMGFGAAIALLVSRKT